VELILLPRQTRHLRLLPLLASLVLIEKVPNRGRATRSSLLSAKGFMDAHL
jgi:hypothetical protein